MWFGLGFGFWGVCGEGFWFDLGWLGVGEKGLSRCVLFLYCWFEQTANMRESCKPPVLLQSSTGLSTDRAELDGVDGLVGEARVEEPAVHLSIRVEAEGSSRVE